MLKLPATAAFLALVIPLLGASAAAASSAIDGPHVVFYDDVPAVMPGDTLLGRTVTRAEPALGFVVVDGAPMRAMTANDGVKRIEPDPRIQLFSTPNDASWNQQYGPQQVRADDAWDVTMGSPNVTICIVDSGVRYTHEDLRGARWLGGIDLHNGDDDPMDDNGHGTHVAGTAAATTGNGRGIAGVAQVGIYGVKVIGSDGSGATSNVASGVRWCADKGANIISMSLGSGSASSTMQSAVKYANERGVLLIAAAGNSGQCNDCVSYPAAFSEVMAVACTTSSRAQCSFSSQGPETSVAAPGYQILSTYRSSDTSYATLSGTSMSTPHVSGVAALVWSAAPGLTNAQVRAILESTAVDLGAKGHDDAFGFGLVDAAAAIAAARGSPSPTPEPTPEPAPSPTPTPEPAPAPWPSRGTPTADAGRSITAKDIDGDGRAHVTLDASASHAPVGVKLTSFTWSLDGIVIANGERADVLLPVGTHRVNLEVATDDGSSDDDSTSVRVRENSAPRGQFSSDCEGFTCSFDASRTRDDGETLTYAWDFAGELSTGLTPTHAFEAEGSYRVRLVVTDEGGATDEVTRTVRVRAPRNDAPDAAFTMDCAVTLCAFDASASRDRDGNIVSYTWTFDDGTTAQGMMTTHTMSLGWKRVRLVVTDDRGAMDDITRSVYVRS